MHSKRQLTCHGPIWQTSTHKHDGRRRLKADCNRSATGTQLIGTDVFCLPVLSTLQQWLLYCTFRVWVRCTLPQGKLTLSSIINYKFFQSCNIFGRDNPQYATISSFTRFLDHAQRRTTVGRTPLNKWSACRRGLYLTTQSHPCFRWD
jgi:hypothetical protein